jgi:hypothetical protein
VNNALQKDFVSLHKNLYLIGDVDNMKSALTDLTPAVIKYSMAPRYETWKTTVAARMELRLSGLMLTMQFIVKTRTINMVTFSDILVTSKDTTLTTGLCWKPVHMDC